MTDDLMRSVRIFEMNTSNGTTDWQFVMPGVAISGGGTKLDYVEGTARATQVVDGWEYVGEGDSHVEAILALISARYRSIGRRL